MRYVAFPRQGLGSPGDEQLQAVWCSADKKAAMDSLDKVVSAAEQHLDRDAWHTQHRDGGNRLRAAENQAPVPGNQRPE